MQTGELISSFLINLQSICRNSVLLKNASFQQIMGIVSLDYDGMEMSRFSLKIGVDNSTATRLVAGLEKKCWVERKKNKYDSRIVIVSLTTKGKSVQKELENQFDKLGEVINGQISSKYESDAVFDSINKLNWALMKLKMETDNIVLCK